jgi:hypothetical protein
MNTTINVDGIIADDELAQQFKALVLERISVMPDTMRIVVGTTEVTKKDIIDHVESEDEVGKQMMEMELEYLRDLVSGAIYST